METETIPFRPYRCDVNGPGIIAAGPEREKKKLVEHACHMQSLVLMHVPHLALSLSLSLYLFLSPRLSLSIPPPSLLSLSLSLSLSSFLKSRSLKRISGADLSPLASISRLVKSSEANRSTKMMSIYQKQL